MLCSKLKQLVFCFVLYSASSQLKKQVRFSDFQRSALRKCFSKNAYPSKATIHKLSEKLGLTESQISGWFYWHRRIVRSDKHVETANGENICAYMYI